MYLCDGSVVWRFLSAFLNNIKDKLEWYPSGNKVTTCFIKLDQLLWWSWALFLWLTIKNVNCEYCIWWLIFILSLICSRIQWTWLRVKMNIAPWDPYQTCDVLLAIGLFQFKIWDEYLSYWLDCIKTIKYVIDDTI